MALAGLLHYSFLQTQHRLPSAINCRARILPFTGGDWGAAFTQNRRCMSCRSTNQCRNIILIKRSATKHASDKCPDGNSAKFPKCITCLQDNIAILYSDTQFIKDRRTILCQDGLKNKEFEGKFLFSLKEGRQTEQWICTCQSSSFFCTTPSSSTLEEKSIESYSVASPARYEEIKATIFIFSKYQLASPPAVNPEQ